MEPESIALVVSIAALIVSVVSLWSSYEVQRHRRTVAFEQRRQEVRQLILQGQLLSQQMNQDVRAALREAQHPMLREDLAEILHLVTGLLKNYEFLVQSLDSVSATTDTMTD
jgi:hypothetical protein